MATVLDDILAARLIGIIRLREYGRAVEVAGALQRGGLRVLEFALTGQGVPEAIAAVRAGLGDALRVGAGTVLDAAAAAAVIDAGAEFIVTPAVVPDVIAVCVRRGVPIACGALTPTEILTASRAGADLVKLFPARLGGPAYVRDVLAPLPHVRLVPTGGVGPENARSFLEAGAVAVAMGGNLVAAEAVAMGRWEEIEANARACVHAVQ